MTPRVRAFAAMAVLWIWHIVSPASALARPTDRLSRTSSETDEQKADKGSLQPIVVTARRSEEDLQRTPISITALGARELEARSLTHLRSLQNFVPNITFAPSQNVGDAAGNLFIRGIGQEDFVAAAEPGVGFYLDGIYVARTMGALIDVIDIARIEVLRGPQGTLYGKNAIGGAINVISAAPGLEAESRADLVAGNLSRIELRGMVNAPLTDRLFVRLAAGHAERGGYLQRLVPPFVATAITQTNHQAEGRDNSVAGRAQLQWRASETLTIDLSADASRRRGTQAGTHIDAFDPRFGILRTVDRLIREGGLPGPEIGDALVTRDLLTSYAGGPSSVAQDISGLAVTVRKDIGKHSVKLIAAQRRLRSRVSTDIDGLYFAVLESNFREAHRQSSAELQASGSLAGATYSAGLFGLDEQARPESGRDGGRFNVLHLCGCFFTAENRPQLTYSRLRTKGQSYAIYAQASVPLVERLTATLGGRYSRERKAIKSELVLLEAATMQPTDIVLASGANRDRWNSFTWRAGLEFQASSEAMFYGSAAKGYKSGGFNSRPVANLANLGLAPFNPETAIAYEAGLRSSLFRRRVRLNATVFYTTYRDIQLRRQTFVDGVLTTLIENAAKARIRGIELEVAARPSPRLTVSGAYGHLDARYLDIGRVPGLTLDSAFQRTPRHSFTTSIDYWLSLGAHTLELHGDYSHRSREQFQLVASAWDQAGYGLLGARVTLRGAGERWSVALFGTNLTDEHYRNAGRSGLTEVGVAYSNIGLPRQVGVQATVGF